MSATITAADFGKLLASDQSVHVVDVRTPAEFSECHVRGARLAPLDALDPRKIADTLQPTDAAPIYLLCKSGTRAGRAADQFRAAGIAHVSVVTGGTEACVAAGLPVERGGKSVIPLDGQIRIALGILFLLCWFLARYVHESFTYLILFFAGGLIFSGVTGFCGLAILLGKAPWNQNRAADSSRIG
jgi:rhodanese-related sulfurtransferase